MTATEQGHTAIVKLLLEAGADVNVLSPMVDVSKLYSYS
jgi:ankyrin repeat protein